MARKRELLRQEIEVLNAAHGRRECAIATKVSAAKVHIAARELLDFTSWDCLELRQHPDVLRALRSELELEGASARAPRLVSGTTAAHARAEDAVARFLGCGRALLLPSRIQAVLSLLTATLTEGDVLIADEVLSAPLADACYLVNAELLQVSLGNVDRVESSVHSRIGEGRRCVLWIESLSPFLGTVAPVVDLARMAEEKGWDVIIDESFALGVLGIRGGGIAGEGAVPSGSLLALLASTAHVIPGDSAFIAGSPDVVELVLHRSRSMAHEIAPSPLSAAATASALQLAELAVGARATLTARVELFRNGLKQLVPTIELGATPIVGIPLSSFRLARELQRALRERGILTEALPLGRLLDESAVVRFIVRSAHSDEDIAMALHVLSDVYRRVVRIG